MFSLVKEDATDLRKAASLITMQVSFRNGMNLFTLLLLI